MTVSGAVAATVVWVVPVSLLPVASELYHGREHRAALPPAEATAGQNR